MHVIVVDPYMVLSLILTAAALLLHWRPVPVPVMLIFGVILSLVPH